MIRKLLSKFFGEVKKNKWNVGDKCYVAHRLGVYQIIAYQDKDIGIPWCFVIPISDESIALFSKFSKDYLPYACWVDVSDLVEIKPIPELTKEVKNER